MGENCSLESSMEDLEVSSQASSCFTTDNGKRISPLRGNTSQEDLIQQTHTVRNGLSALRDDHYNVLARIRDDFENQRNSAKVSDDERDVLQDRIANVTSSLEKLEVGIEESTVMLALSDHFQRLEADRSTLRLEMGRIVDENDWLREELSDTQKRLIDAEAELAELREEKRQREFMDELKNVNENNLRPITPSKIPVGKYRVEQEKDINRAMSGGGTDSNRTSRSTSPAPSRIPMGNWRNKMSAYKKVMEKQESQANMDNQERNKRQYFKLNSLKSSHIPTTTHTNIMSRSSGSKIASR